MPKSPNQKLKILYLMRILLEETDESHSLTINEIIAKLNEYGVSAERKTLYDDIEALRLFGHDIVTKKGKTYNYYVANRLISKNEFKQLAKAVMSSDIFPQSTARKLLKKTGTLTSRYITEEVIKNAGTQNSTEAVRVLTFGGEKTVASGTAYPPEGKAVNALVIFDATVIKEAELIFGKNAQYRDLGDGRMSVKGAVYLTPDFYGRIFALGEKAEIKAPDDAVFEIKKRAKDMLYMYCGL